MDKNIYTDGILPYGTRLIIYKNFDDLIEILDQDRYVNNYILSNWDCNIYLTKENGKWKIKETFGTELEVNKSYILIKPKEQEELPELPQ